MKGGISVMYQSINRSIEWWMNQSWFGRKKRVEFKLDLDIQILIKIWQVVNHKSLANSFKIGLSFQKTNRQWWMKWMKFFNTNDDTFILTNQTKDCHNCHCFWFVFCFVFKFFFCQFGSRFDWFLNKKKQSKKKLKIYN